MQPAPAMTGTRPEAVPATVRITVVRSCRVRVAASPVVPQGTSAAAPLWICHSVSRARVCRSTEPSGCIGVTSAVAIPRNRSCFIMHTSLSFANI